MSLSIATKTLAVGTEQNLILGARDCYQRPSALPPNWQQIKIGLILSFTSPGSDNGSPNTEYVGGGGDVGNCMAFGLTNGVGYLGQAGNKFVGMAHSGLSNGLQYTSGKWNLASYVGSTALSPGATQSNGTAVTVGTTVNLIPALSMTDPVGTAAMCAFFGIELDVSVAGELTVKYAQANDQNVTDTATLLAWLSSASFGNSTVVTGGWWSAAGTPIPVGCEYLYIRNPFINNRIRVHNSAIKFLT